MRINLDFKTTLFSIIIAVMTVSCSGRTIESGWVSSSARVIKGKPYFLPKALIPLEVTLDKNIITIVANDTLYTPDPAAQFTARFKESSFSNDELLVSTSEQGLLASANSVVTDESVNITKKLLSIITEFAKFSALEATPSGDESFSYKFLIDPFNRRSMRHAIEKLWSQKLRLSVADLEGKPIPYFTAEKARKVAQSCEGSLCFRFLTPVIIKLKSDEEDKKINHQFLAMVPDPRRVGQYDVRRGACIQRTEKLIFVNGMLTSAELKKPSEVLGCLEIPLDIIKAILALPGALLTFRVNNINNQKGLVAAQSQLLNSQASLLTAQSQLVATQQSQLQQSQNANSN